MKPQKLARNPKHSAPDITHRNQTTWTSVNRGGGVQMQISLISKNKNPGTYF